MPYFAIFTSSQYLILQFSQVHNTLFYIVTTVISSVVFQLPVVAFVLGKMEIITSGSLSRYHKHAFIIIMFIVAVMTVSTAKILSPEQIL